MNLRERVEELEKHAMPKHTHVWPSWEQYDKWVAKTGGCDCDFPHIHVNTTPLKKQESINV